MQIHFPKKLSPEQMTILRSEPREIEIIKGAAGSGKTVTALLKMAFVANYYLRAHGRARVQVLSFNRTLQSYINEIIGHPSFSSRLRDNGELQLRVDTFAKWALRICGTQDPVITSSKAYLESRAANRANRPLSSRFGDDFIADEMEYVLKRFPHDNLDTYIGATRTGRGAKPAISGDEKKILIEDYIRPYEEWKARNGLEDWSDLAWQAYSQTEPFYDIIVVDEGQDFSANQYRAVMKSLLPDSCFICVVDSAQNIYLNGFTWSECGIDAVRHHPQTLGHNFRNTQQVARLSKALLEGMALDENGVMPTLDPDMPTGPLPVLLEGKFTDQLAYMLDRIKEAANRKETSAILIKAEKWFDRTEKELGKAGIDFEKIVRAGEWPDRDVYVVLSTMHSAKGLEFDHVFLPGVNDQLFPAATQVGSEIADRDRRLLAMAVGRARKTVVIGQKPGETCPYFDAIPATLLKRVRV